MLGYTLENPPKYTHTTILLLLAAFLIDISCLAILINIAAVMEIPPGFKWASSFYFVK